MSVGKLTSSLLLSSFPTYRKRWINI